MRAFPNGVDAHWILVPYAALILIALVVLETCGACR